MKRSRKTALVLMGSAPLLLVACARQPDVQTSEGLFTSVEACTEQTMNPSMCRQAFDGAQAQADAVAPRYASVAECEAEFGEGQCATRQQAGGGSFVGPMMAGFFLSQMMNGRGGAMAPGGAAAPAAGATSGARTAPAFLSNQSGWLRPQAGPGGATALARTDLQPDRAPTVRRGGFGRSGAGRSAGG